MVTRSGDSASAWSSCWLITWPIFLPRTARLAYSQSPSAQSTSATRSAQPRIWLGRVGSTSPTPSVNESPSATNFFTSLLLGFYSVFGLRVIACSLGLHVLLHDQLAGQLAELHSRGSFLHAFIARWDVAESQLVGRIGKGQRGVRTIMAVGEDRSVVVPGGGFHESQCEGLQQAAGPVMPVDQFGGNLGPGVLGEQSLAHAQLRYCPEGGRVDGGQRLGIGYRTHGC